MHRPTRGVWRYMPSRHNSMAAHLGTLTAELQNSVRKGLCRTSNKETEIKKMGG